MATVTYPQATETDPIQDDVRQPTKVGSDDRADMLETSAERSFWQIQSVTVPIGMLVVFVLTASIEGFVHGGAADSIGLGLFMAFWLGLGGGFMVGGVLWGLEQEAADGA